MLSGAINNIGCILVKLADREHNLKTLHHMPADKQVKKSFESQSLYIPLMHII
jgi:guanosine-3',5'-bis(diphosphate) 3'-pyrophosphohydrolase